MVEKYLVVNAGSSSLKFSLYELPENSEDLERDAKLIVNGNIEKMGDMDSFYTLKFDGKKVQKAKPIMNHSEAVQTMIDEMLQNGFITDINEIKGIGHRIVHGGEKYSDSTLITNEVIKHIEDMTKFAPLHHPGEIAGILSMQNLSPEVTQVAVFDTAFHQTMPIENYLYAIPYSFYEENGVRKYGFHGTSHKYIMETMQKHYDKKDVNLIICHLGSGVSISCIKNGKCIDTTMGMTPLDGVVMGTRSGAIDPSIIGYICKEKNISVDDTLLILNRESGILGIAGKNDLRDIDIMINNGFARAKLALEIFTRSIVKYISQYYVELNGEVDALVLTAGAGENAINLREGIVNAIARPLNVGLNKEENDLIASFKNKQRGIISTEDSSFDIMVIPTNEEYMILKDTYKISKEVSKTVPKTRKKEKTTQ